MQKDNDIVKLLRVAVVIWLAYFVLSASIDYTLKNPGPIEEYCYIVNFIIACFMLVISFWSWFQNKLGKIFLPLLILLISILPIVANQIILRFLFQPPLPPPEALFSRSVPFLLIALLLIAWQYRWQHILIFNVAVAAVNVAIILTVVPRDNPALSAALFAVLVQVFTFLVVGFFISVMMGWLRNQRLSLEEANKKLTNYAQTLEDLAISRERNRIAQELHDTLNHTLSGLSVQLEAMKAYWDIDPATARQRLDKSLTAARSGLEETRRVLMALRARPLEELGLAQAIRQMAEEAVTHSGIALDMAIADNMPPLLPDTEQCIFRVAQEAITNVIKHAKAQKLTVRLEFKDNRAVLTVQDNGTGFDIGSTNTGKTFGLLGMKERVEFVKGKLNIITHIGDGTTVQLTI